ncbi:anoctamin-8-like [Ostrinia nubilalis]|uniref:anoctamin-8-like n=1 Tax=Ostrinia nubilalis TaxID=29057 RepID=UPI0030822FD0
MEGEDGGLGAAEKEECESSTHSTPQEHKSFAEFAKDKLDSAGRELRRRLPMAGQLGAHLMHPRRLLLHSTPTQQTDVVLIFPKGLPDSMLLWLLQKLRGSRPRLRVCVRQHASSQCSAFYITADDDVLLQTAEEVHLPKLLKPEFGGGYKEFTVRDMHCFQKGSSAAELLNSQERGALVKHVLESARAEPGDEHALEPALTLRPGQSIVPACVSRGVVASMFPLHERNALENLRKKWVKTFFSPQPLDEISEYFGVKIAMYFAWLGHYTQSLTVPAVVGFIFWIWLGTANENWKDIAYVLFSLFNVLWACVYLETWKRYSNALAYKWGTLDQRDDLLVEPRPLFEGEMGTSPVTGRPEPQYAAWRRRVWRHCVSLPVMLVCLSVATVATFAFLRAQHRMTTAELACRHVRTTLSPVTGRPEPQYAAWRRRVWRHCVSLPVMLVCLSVATVATFAFLRAQDWWETRIVYFTWIPRAFLAIIIAVEEEVYARIARWLNDKENYRLETKYENHLIVKIALFQFVNSFMSLFYIAFYIQDMDKLKEQLAVLLITRQVIGNLKESALPYLIENLRLAKICIDVFGALSPSKVPTSAQLTEMFDKKTDSSGDAPENSLINGTDPDRRDSEPIVGQKVIHQAELESQLFKRCKKTDSSGDAPENSLINGTDPDRRDSEPIVGQKVIHQAELESQLFKRCKKTDSSGDAPENSLINGTYPDRRDSEPIVGQKVIHQAELESQLFKYEGTFAEYLEMLTQLGHVVLFSSAFPLAALCALLNNAAEVRADAFKLCHVAQRPFGERISNIGSWQHAMEAMVGVAVLVNCALIGLSGPVHRLLPGAAPAHSVLLIVALEHVILVVVLALRMAIPEIPAWLATEMAKVEFQRREAIKNAHAPLLPSLPQKEATRPEHVILVVVLALRMAIPEIPAWLATEMAKVEFQRREAIKNAHAPLLFTHVILVVVLALRMAIPEIPAWLATEMAKVEFQRREAIKNAHAPLLSECASSDDVRTPARSTPRATPTTPRVARAPPHAEHSSGPTTDRPKSPMAPGNKINIGKIPEIPPFRSWLLYRSSAWHMTSFRGDNLRVSFRPKAASITEPVTTGSLQMLQDVSPTKPIRRKEVVPGAPLSLLGVRGLRDEPLHRSAHCIPHPAQHRPLVNPTLQELSGSVSAGGSEPDLNAVPSTIDISATSSEDDKPKDKGSRSRAKAALVKRVRSVAVFSLGLRKAREAHAAAERPARTPATPDKQVQYDMNLI